MRKSSSGFTIVELLIVIVVIAILATISIVAYTGIQNRAENSKTISGVAQSVKILESYKVLNGNFPLHAGVSYACIGTGYENDTCHTAADGVTPLGANSAAFNQALQTVATLPQLSTKPLTIPSGAIVTGASFSSNENMIRYHLIGANQPCSAGGTGYNYGSITQCRIILE